VERVIEDESVMGMAGVAFVGCGYVADFYARTLAGHPELDLIGVHDRDPERARRFSAYFNVPAYASLEEALDDDRVAIVVNLTNPESHYDVSRAALEAGRHVYTEKPLAMDVARAQELVDLAGRQSRLLASAPCSVLGETAQTLWKALRDGRVGKVRLVYAELDDGMVHRMPYRRWVSESGTPWPSRNEFQVGCTLEHAGYQVTWLTAFFGPAESVTAFASCQVPDKMKEAPEESMAPDFSVAAIRFASGVVARLTCSIVAPHDHSLRIVGDEGVLGTRDCWYYGSPVHIQRFLTIRRRMVPHPLRKRVPLVRRPPRYQARASAQMDFARGIAEMASAIAEKRPCRLSPEYGLHNTEIVLAIHDAARLGTPYRVRSTFSPMEPMPWAQ
jgi:predicted dehydrogenase